jgi:hypothetical protein
MAIRARMRIWSVRRLALGTVYALGACSRAARHDPGSGELAFSTCADSLSWAHPVLPVPESTTAAPVLLVGTKGDPATPYSGAVALVRAIGPSATLLTASGGGHTAFGRWRCVGDHVTRYLIEVRVPEGQAC